MVVLLVLALALYGLALYLSRGQTARDTAGNRPDLRAGWIARARSCAASPGGVVVDELAKTTAGGAGRRGRVVRRHVAPVRDRRQPDHQRDHHSPRGLGGRRHPRPRWRCAAPPPPTCATGPSITYGLVALLFLLMVAWGRRRRSAAALRTDRAAVVLGTEALRRQTCASSLTRRSRARAAGSWIAYAARVGACREHARSPL